ncbi:hypothetical protein PHLGIDRAFT_374637 [Phlebiopsis gigantea 11061_1 CR5-6]|uniref:Uncharacterized protein n=1 Tax=Phlebiopsis gigantea (strain 11061_1 CR5-6) TaxID=745531 RepID=A0A0C3S1C9_PHLG1|nr:hypothetical protein PHLGIDRAFT_374637 [Phlebiopsis gigantea 11061_1 CR5-6]
MQARPRGVEVLSFLAHDTQLGLPPYFDSPVAPGARAYVVWGSGCGDVGGRGRHTRQSVVDSGEKGKYKGRGGTPPTAQRRFVHLLVRSRSRCRRSAQAADTVQRELSPVAPNFHPNGGKQSHWATKRYLTLLGSRSEDDLTNSGIGAGTEPLRNWLDRCVIVGMGDVAPESNFWGLLYVGFPRYFKVSDEKNNEHSHVHRGGQRRYLASMRGYP